MAPRDTSSPDSHGTRPDPQRIHEPVLRERTMELLEPAIGHPGAVLVDATVGMAGHAAALLQRFPGAILVGIDRDHQALAIARKRLAAFGQRVHLVHAVYDELSAVLGELGIHEAAGILFDLGVSSLQLDQVDRGFSYAADAPLDMRMDTGSTLTAQRILAEYAESELRRIFWQYGEEKLASRYARRIVESRASGPLHTSSALVSLLEEATPAAARRAGHPAKRVFQALRIEVNQELAALEGALVAAIDALAIGGRMVVLSYQSLEDRLVKQAFVAGAASTAPAGLPVELPEHEPVLRLLVRGAERASETEIDTNPRSASVRLRAVERVRRAT